MSITHNLGGIKMSGERVSVIEGKKPVILFAPHGYENDDEHTAHIVEQTANITNCYAVINRGWERSDAVDHLRDKANCNNVKHCKQDVVREEILDPILRYRSKILATYSLCYFLIIHGMSNNHRDRIGEDELDIVIGYGAGNPDSFSCATWRKDLFGFLLSEAGFHVYQGKAGGPLSGWAKKNMNQLFRKNYNDRRVHSMQIEIIKDLREDQEMSTLVAEYLAGCMDDLIHSKNWQKPPGFNLREC